MWDSVQHVGLGSSGSNGTLASHGGHLTFNYNYRAISLCDSMPLAEEKFLFHHFALPSSSSLGNFFRKRLRCTLPSMQHKDRMLLSDNHGRAFVHTKLSTICCAFKKRQMGAEYARQHKSGLGQMPGQL
jgi:hypothetical protein